jgi:hypothetical protein
MDAFDTHIKLFAFKNLLSISKKMEGDLKNNLTTRSILKANDRFVVLF